QEWKLPVKSVYWGRRELRLGKWRNPVREQAGKLSREAWKPTPNQDYGVGGCHVVPIWLN
ncbi:MAG: hypothetical protein RIM23_00495, partial [Coleofasciculus sp. G3-WIS-01]|uniref:hypothetical protein n=1 Tax=Coleofasciculus sp. G3-WIS-01 TaxID=3069528 RepID=UPI0032FDA13D